MEIQQPKVGIGILVFKDGKILFGKRKGSHGAGEYGFPGGHLEYMESFEECARREIMEECGIEVTNIQFQFLANVTAYAPKHYVHVTLTAEYAGGELVVKEPDKCETWDWYDLDHLPEPLFKMCPMAIEAYRTKRNYFDGE